MKKVPSYWWDFLGDGISTKTDFEIIVESNRSDGVPYIKANSIHQAEQIISDLNAGRMTWPKN